MGTDGLLKPEGCDVMAAAFAVDEETGHGFSAIVGRPANAGNTFPNSAIPPGSRGNA